MSMKKFWQASCLFFLLVAFPPTVAVAETPPAPLPSEARVAFDEGMVAVGQQQWTVAIRNFLKAQKIAPEAPEVLFNLGLAESKVPGRELRAIAWFQAFLLAVPTAANAEAVRKEIVSLKVRAEGTLEKLVSGAKQMASQFTEVWERESALQHIAVAQARAGDFDGAVQTARRGTGTSINTMCVYETLMKIAVIQYNAGDHAGAMDTIRVIETGNWDKRPGAKDRHLEEASRAYRYITDLQAAAGEFSKADATCQRSDLFDQVEALEVLAWMEAIAGKKDEALAHAEKTVKLCAEGATRTERVPYIGAIAIIQPILRHIAILQAILGDVTTAKKTDALFPANPYPSYLEYFLKSNDPQKYKEYLLLHHFDFDSEEGRLKIITGEARIFHRRPKSTASDAIYLINNYLSSELFTDPRSALQAIAATPHKKTEFYEPKRNEQFDGIEDAILRIADGLNAVMKLGR